MRLLSFLRTVWSGLCVAIAGAMLAAGLLCLINPHRSPLYLADIFTLPLLTACVVITACLFLIRQTWAGRLGIVAVAVWVMAVSTQAFALQRPADMSVAPVRVMFANLYIYNKTPERLLPWVQAQKPDIIATVENFGRADRTLTPMLKADYPYQYQHRDTVVYSRFPIESSHHGETQYSFDQVDIHTPQGLTHLAVVHLCQPKPRTHWCQISQLERLRTDIPASQRGNMIMVGDFNSSLSGYLLQDFARDMGLRPVAAPIGTWPSVLPGILRINIDNAFAGSAFSLSNRHVGPDDGSDHRPIVVDVRPAKSVKN